MSFLLLNVAIFTLCPEDFSDEAAVGSLLLRHIVTMLTACGNRIRQYAVSDEQGNPVFTANIALEVMHVEAMLSSPHREVQMFVASLLGANIGVREMLESDRARAFLFLRKKRFFPEARFSVHGASW